MGLGETACPSHGGRPPKPAGGEKCGAVQATRPLGRLRVAPIRLPMRTERRTNRTPAGRHASPGRSIFSLLADLSACDVPNTSTHARVRVDNVRRASSRGGGRRTLGRVLSAGTNFSSRRRCASVCADSPSLAETGQIAAEGVKERIRLLPLDSAGADVRLSLADRDAEFIGEPSSARLPPKRAGRTLAGANTRWGRPLWSPRLPQ